MTVALFLRANAVLWGATLAVAVAVAALPGAAAAAREAFGFRFDATREGSWSDAATYFGTNLRVVSAVLLAAWARSRCRPLGPAFDALIATVIASNAALVGAAVGAYGPQTIPSLPHLPAEWAAVAVAIGLCLVARRAALSASDIVRSGLASSGLLAAAAVIEAFAPV
jgi:hypothetical protein